MKKDVYSTCIWTHMQSRTNCNKQDSRCYFLDKSGVTTCRISPASMGTDTRIKKHRSFTMISPAVKNWTIGIQHDGREMDCERSFVMSSSSLCMETIPWPHPTQALLCTCKFELKKHE